MHISKFKLWPSLFIWLLSAQTLLAKESFSEKIVEQAKKSVVTIQVTASFSAYGQTGQWMGTGCVVDKKRGYLLTNRHVIGDAVIGNYKVTFFNGIQQEAKVIYYDPWLDYGFLKVEPAAIPQEVTEISFSRHNPVIDQPIFMVGNNEGYSFSLHTGVVADLYDIVGIMPQQAIKLNLNSRGGSSGSPIFDKNGYAIALNYAGDNTFAFAIHPEYLRYALAAIQKGSHPIRKQIGAIVKSAAIGDLVQYNRLPPLVQKKYIKTFPGGATRVIQVDYVLPHSPSAGLLFPGDLIWSVDGRQIGPNLISLDMAMNKTTKNYVQLTIFRNGQWHDIKVGLYDLDAHKITTMVYFGGAMFFEMDDYCAKINTIPAKSLSFIKTDTTHIFNNITSSKIKNNFNIKILCLDEKPVTDLKGLIGIIPLLSAKKYFTIDYIDWSPFYAFSQMHLGPRECKGYVEYRAYIPKPRLFIWDETDHQWKSQPI